MVVQDFVSQEHNEKGRSALSTGHCIVHEQGSTRSALMAKKRKSENTGLDEVERTLYTSFCTAANSISQLYTQAQHQQKVAFQAGERQGLERLCQWLQREQQVGSNISIADVVTYLQNELDGEEMTTSPGPQLQQQLLLSQQQLNHHQHQQHLHSNNQVPPGATGYSALGVHAGRIGGGTDQHKVSFFSSALSSPNRRSLPPFPAAQGVYGPISNGAAANPHHETVQEEQETPATDQGQAYNSSSLSSHPQSGNAAYGYNSLHGQHRDPHNFGENDAHMDMHAEGGPDGYYQ